VGNRGWRGPLEASSPEILNSVIGPKEIHLFTNPKANTATSWTASKAGRIRYFPVEIGHRVATVCHLANIAIKRGHSSAGIRKLNDLKMMMPRMPCFHAQCAPHGSWKRERCSRPTCVQIAFRLRPAYDFPDGEGAIL